MSERADGTPTPNGALPQAVVLSVSSATPWDGLELSEALAVAQQAQRDLVLDLVDTGAIDLSALGFLARASDELRLRGREVILRGASPEAVHALELAGLGDRVRTVPAPGTRA